MMVYMIGRFMYHLREYNDVMNYMESHPRVKQEAVMRGEYADFFSSRCRYAWKMTGIEWRHRDRYGRKCRKAGGNCARCNAKHC